MWHRRAVVTTYSARVNESESSLVLDAEAITIAGVPTPWHAVDAIADEGHALTLEIRHGIAGNADVVVIDRLGDRRDTFAREARELCATARRPILGHGDASPLRSFLARDRQAVVDIEVLPSGLTIQPRGAVARFLPWGLVTDMERIGHRVVFHTRVVDLLDVGGVGARTDEFEAVCRDALATSRGADGWALPVDVETAAMEEVASVLQCLSLLNEPRLAQWPVGADQVTRFLLAPTARGHIVLEAVDMDDHATFAFAADDIERVNAALLQVGFAREVLWRDEEELGPWVAALRTQPDVLWLRESLRERVIHDDGWSQRVRDL